MPTTNVTTTRGRGRRIALIAGALVAVGLAITVVLAWSVVVWGGSDFSVTRQLVSQRPGQARARCLEERSWGHWQWIAADDLPARVDEVSGEPPKWVWTPTPMADTCVTDAFGWPLPALYQGRLMNFRTNPPTGYQMPLGCAWVGIAVDAAVWSFAAGAALIGVREARRRLRKRPGLCPSCGYDRRGLAGDAPCPECGAKA